MGEKDNEDLGNDKAEGQEDNIRDSCLPVIGFCLRIEIPDCL